MAKHISKNRLYQLPPDVVILSDVEHAAQNRIDITVSIPEQERICPKCGSHSCCVKDSGRERTVRHLPVSGRSAFVTYRSRRFVCRGCGSSYYEPVDWIHGILRMTNALVTDICLKLTEMKSMHVIAKEELVTDECVSAVFDSISIPHPARLPEVLCVDEFKGDAGDWNPSRSHWDTHKLLCNISDGSAGILIDVLPSIKSADLEEYFRQWTPAERARVKFFCCDMHSGFTSIGRKCFPNAKVCIDHFHVTKRLNDAMAAIRRRIQASLTSQAAHLLLQAESEPGPHRAASIRQEREDVLKDYRLLKGSRLLLVTKESSKERLWGASQKKNQERLALVLASHPEISEMYDRLQEFHSITETMSYAMQRADFSGWLGRSLASDVPEIRSAAATLKHWRSYIQNSWKFGHSNGPCEGINNKIKILKRNCYGVHDFGNFRKRLLLVCGSVHPDYTPATLFQRKTPVQKEGEHSHDKQ